MERERYIPGVDGLRAIAVLTVVLFHAGFSTFSGGFVGVDVFFVISGFLITRLIVDEVASNGRFDFGGFYVRRARRLFPALFVSLVACFVLSFLLFTPQHLQHFGSELLYAAISLSNVFFWSESGYFDTSADFKPLLHTWSLSVEEQFYLVWPALLFVLLRKTGKRGVWACLLMIAALSLYGNLRFQNGLNAPFMNISEWLTQRLKNGESTIFFLTPFRLFEFVIGAALVWLRPCIKFSRQGLEVAMATGVGMIVYAVFRFDQNTVFPSCNALIPCVGAALVILSVDAPVAGMAVRNGASVFVGTVSYSVYLVHWPILVFYRYWRMTPIDATERITLVIVSLIAGSLLYRYVEAPFRKPAVVRMSRRGVSLTCLSLVLGLSLVASIVRTGNGFPWRSVALPATLAEQVKTSQDKYGGDGFPEPTAWINERPSGRADIVVIGDSHAGQYKTGLMDIVAGPTGKSIFFSTASCLIMPNMTRFTPEANWDYWCPKALDNALEVLKHSPDAPVVLAEAWSFQIRRAAFADQHRHLYDGRHMDAAITQLGPRLDALRGAIGHRHLLIVGEVPGPGVEDAIGCFRRPKYLHIGCDSILSTPEKSNPAQRVNGFLQRYALQHENVSFVSPFTALCDGLRCRTFQDGEVVYSDEFHLSKFGSRAVIGALKSEFIKTSLLPLAAAVQ